LAQIQVNQLPSIFKQHDNKPVTYWCEKEYAFRHAFVVFPSGSVGKISGERIKCTFGEQPQELMKYFQKKMAHKKERVNERDKNAFGLNGVQLSMKTDQFSLLIDFCLTFLVQRVNQSAATHVTCDAIPLNLIGELISIHHRNLFILDGFHHVFRTDHTVPFCECSTDYCERRIESGKNTAKLNIQKNHRKAPVIFRCEFGLFLENASELYSTTWSWFLPVDILQMKLNIDDKEDNFGVLVGGNESLGCRKNVHSHTSDYVSRITEEVTPGLSDSVWTSFHRFYLRPDYVPHL
ncbi:hypothetical protein CLF_109068, partial [Clonorchis sinensis]